MSARELAAVTRIAPRLVAALEEDRYDAFPAEVFVRGFLRNCARELRLDADALVAQYEAFTGQAPRPSLADELAHADEVMNGLFESGRWPRASYLVAVLAIILGLGLSLLIFGGSETEQLSDRQTPSWEDAAP